MSTKQERKAMTDLAVDAWASVDALLRDRGERWPDTDVITWGVGLQLRFRAVRTLEDALKIIDGPPLAGDRQHLRAAPRAGNSGQPAGVEV